ncbi:MAG: hypothetical protein IAG13_25450, partial [Deltaproteobacteria bacterium]|nr:hypothetical protein [Nannocystaceae bacterium]
LGVPAGVPVSLYEGGDATGTLIETKMTPEPLLPGASAQLIWGVDAAANGGAASFFVEVDGEAEDGAVAECDESNNTALTESAACPIPG